MTPQPIVSSLFLLNICLQLFDGIATYHGLQLHYREANPLIQATIPHWGEGMTILLFKANACCFLLLLWRLSGLSAGNAQAGVKYLPHILGSLAGFYFIFAFVPWLYHYLALLASLYNFRA